MVISVKVSGHFVRTGFFKFDPDRLRPLRDFSPIANLKQLKSALGMFAYHTKWIDHFTGKVRLLANAKTFLTHTNGDILSFL